MTESWCHRCNSVLVWDPPQRNWVHPDTGLGWCPLPPRAEASA